MTVVSDALPVIFRQINRELEAVYRVELEKSLRETEDYLNEMPGVSAMFDLDEAPHYSSFCRWEQDHRIRELRPACSAEVVKPRSTRVAFSLIKPATTTATARTIPVDEDNCLDRRELSSDQRRALHDAEVMGPSYRDAGLPPERGRPACVVC